MCCLSDRVYFGQSLIDLAETQSPAFWGWNMQYEIKTPDGHLTGLHYQEQPKGAYIVGVRSHVKTCLKCYRTNLKCIHLCVCLEQ